MAGKIIRRRKAAVPVRTNERDPREVALALLPELRIVFDCDAVRYFGTAEQLVEEGILPPGFVFPEGGEQLDGVSVPGCTNATVMRSKVRPGKWNVYAWMPMARRRGPYTERDKWADIGAMVAWTGTPEGTEHINRFCAAHSDKQFMHTMKLRELVRVTCEAMV